MNKLYYGRHGQTKDIVARRRSRRDTVLTEQGVREATAMGMALRNQEIIPSLIICSGLLRAIQSADIVASVVGYETDHIIQESLFNERVWGEAEGMLHADVERRWTSGFEGIQGLETIEALQQRAAQALAWLNRYDTDTIVVIGHGTFGRAIVREVEGRPCSDESLDKKIATIRTGQVIRLLPQPTRAL